MSYEPLRSITPIAPDWLEVEVPRVADTVRVLVRWEYRGGRAVVRSLLLDGELDAAVMRTVSRARIEAGLNHPGRGAPGSGRQATVEDWGDALTPDVRAFTGGLAAYLEKPRKRSGRRAARPAARQRLTRPDGRDPAAFYRSVALAYAEAGTRPAPVIAEEAGVPVATARGWIAEARRRGFLPPARRGSAG